MSDRWAIHLWLIFWAAYGGSLINCKCCWGTGDVVCRSCFSGDPQDLMAVRRRMAARQDDESYFAWGSQMEELKCQWYWPIFRSIVGFHGLSTRYHGERSSNVSHDCPSMRCWKQSQSYVWNLSCLRSSSTFNYCLRCSQSSGYLFSKDGTTDHRNNARTLDTVLYRDLVWRVDSWNQEWFSSLDLSRPSGNHQRTKFNRHAYFTSTTQGPRAHDKDSTRHVHSVNQTLSFLLIPTQTLCISDIKFFTTRSRIRCLFSQTCQSMRFPSVPTCPCLRAPRQIDIESIMKSLSTSFRDQQKRTWFWS